HPFEIGGYMQISSFTPTQGPPGTQVEITLPAMGTPLDISTENTAVLISGDPQVTLNSVTGDNQLDGNFVLSVTIDDNAQSGDFVVVVQSRSGTQAAQSASVFTVTRPQHEPV